MSQSGNAIARKVRYTGRVQGVGFRATAEWIARSYRVAGWVRNLPDGSVELLAEGEPAEVDRFLQAVRERWEGSVDNEEAEPVEPTGSFLGFTTRR